MRRLGEEWVRGSVLPTGLKLYYFSETMEVARGKVNDVLASLLNVYEGCFAEKSFEFYT